MATYYWVGGNGTWTSSSTTNWAATSGGAGGAGVPTSADNVIFDGSSGTGTINCTGGTAVCLDLTVLATATQSLALFSGPTKCYGNLTVATASNFNPGGPITFSATTTGNTIDFGGKTNTGGISFNGVGGDWTFQRAYTAAGSLNFSIVAGTVNTNNFAITTDNISSSGALTRALNLGSSTVTLYGTVGISFSGSGFTFNAGTSSISLTNTSIAGITSNGATLNNVTTSASQTSIGDAAVFNNFTITTPNTSSGKTLSLAANITVNGTFTTTVSGVSVGAYRTTITTSSAGTQRTITAAAASLIDTDFYGIVAAGAAAPFAGTRLSDRTGNSNITFPASKTVYLVGTLSATFQSSAWATSSGGATSGTNYPLAQDTVVIDNNSANAGININTSGAYVYEVNLANRTNTATIGGGNNLTIFGNFVGNSVVTWAPFNWYLAGVGSFTVNPNGSSMATAITVTPWASSGTYQLSANLTTSSTATLSTGNLDLNSFILTCTTFTVIGTGVKTLAFGTGKIVVTSSGTVVLSVAGNTLTCTGSRVIESNYSGATGTRTFAQSAVTEANSLSIKVTAGTDAVTTSSSVYDFDFTGFSGTLTNINSVYGSLTFSAGMTVTATGTAFFSATSGIKTFTTNNISLGSLKLTFGAVASTTIWQLVGNVTTTGAITLNYGTFDSNGYSVTTDSLSSANTNTRGLIMGASIWTVTGTAGWGVSSGTFTLNAGTSTINLTAATAKGFTGGSGKTYYNIVQAGAGALTINDGNTYNNISNTVQPTTITFRFSTVQIFSNFSLSGTAGNLVTINSSTAGTQVTLRKPSTWYMGANSTNVLNNTNLVFTAGGGIDYLSVRDMRGQLDAVGSVSETATFTDTQTGGVFLGGAISETVTLTDTLVAGFGLNASVVETATFTDSRTGNYLFLLNVNEAPSITDSYVGGFQVNAAYSDTVTLTDTTTGAGRFAGALSDTVTYTDTETGGFSVVGSLAESVTFTDSQTSTFVANASVLNSITVTDTNTSSAAFLGTRAETVTFTDANGSSAAFSGVQVETTTLTDAPSANGIFIAACSETVTFSEILGRLSSYFVDYTETTSFSDVYTGGFFIGVTVTDSVTFSDAAAAQAAFAGTALEGMDIYVLQDVVLAFNCDVRELFSTTDDLGIQIQYIGALAEIITLTTLAYYEGWFRINDSQTSNWAEINNYQG